MPIDRASAVVWDVAAGGSPKSFGPAYDFELGGDGTSIVVWTNGTGLTVFDIATGQPIREIDTPAGVEYWDFEIDPTGQARRTRLRHWRDASTSSTWRPVRFEARSSSATRCSRSSVPTGASWPSRATTA